MKAEQNHIPYLTPEHLADPLALQTYIYDDNTINYYWTDNWDPGFYIELAYTGFISVGMNHDELGDILLPEMQFAYALLDWENLHVSRKIKKLGKSGFLEKEEFYITFGKTVDPVIGGIAEAYSGTSWITSSYHNLLRSLITSETLPRGFILHAIEMYHGKTGRLVAGEIGYTIGTIYTSLTGFFNRRDPMYNNMGTVQLVCLGIILKQAGYACWNLGHPYMQYKINVGSKILKRPDFLAQWHRFRDRQIKTPFARTQEQRFDCGEIVKRVF
ncbi:MAG: hypothetical protein JXJ04_03065 [Spirochaetales bacterium]|nr:hypothetical protein [Spirochaetales bacterium]